MRPLLLVAAAWFIEATSPPQRLDLDAGSPRAEYRVRISANADAFPSRDEAAVRGVLRIHGRLTNSRTPVLASVVEVRVLLTHDETGATVETEHLIEASQSARLGIELPWIEGPCEEMPGCEKTLTITLELVEPSMDDTVDVEFRATATLEGPQGQRHPEREPKLEVEVERLDR
jgi:hypothetical protein